VAVQAPESGFVVGNLLTEGVSVVAELIDPMHFVGVEAGGQIRVGTGRSWGQPWPELGSGPELRSAFGFCFSRPEPDDPNRVTPNRTMAKNRLGRRFGDHYGQHRSDVDKRLLEHN